LSLRFVNPRELGFLRYNAVCAQVIGADDPHRYVLGSLCEKALLAEYEPYELVTLEEWQETLSEIREYLELQTTRIAFAEVLVYHFDPHASESHFEETCQPMYLDIEPNSYECHVTNKAYELGFEGYFDNTFRPNDTINNAEIVKLTVMAAELPAEEETGCFEGVCEDGEEWFCRYLDAACEAGILPDSFPRSSEGISSIPPRKESFHLVYEAKLFN
jgi:hypothetical protein